MKAGRRTYLELDIVIRDGGTRGSFVDDPDGYRVIFIVLRVNKRVEIEGLALIRLMRLSGFLR